uniref:Uncharacterized protein n=1 Tax=Arundo donax TaxID=35708 RepID=A0A0A8XTQ1_ARUDO
MTELAEVYGSTNTFDLNFDAFFFLKKICISTSWKTRSYFLCFYFYISGSKVESN